MSQEPVRVRLLFVDDGEYHRETIVVPAAALESHERLIDALREDPAVLKDVWIDVGRLCAAYRVENGEG
ncbi:MAG: hypothetical protein KY453_05090 [Gemmatimonadetes bacterium]|nr:hypothetical protein [Gemmatimonadota bacterium]